MASSVARTSSPHHLSRDGEGQESRVAGLRARPQRRRRDFLRYTLEHQAKLAGLICESFAHQLPAPDIALAVLKGLSHIVPNAHVLKLDNSGLSRDPKVVEALNNDPFVADEVQPTDTVAAMLRGDERLKKEFSQITLPVFILHGTLDRVTKPSGSQHFYDMAGSTDKTLKLYEGHFHDLLNDLDKDVVLADIQQWMDARIPVA